ncbi:hypothetical protein Sste5346_006728 [Sporothrix stenoceras]|uniref:Zn(2)-C6 fungal-type domain-containing protein n=1 Tax=Sporothrix stenoceras TaxID=5173 RepID=A0ABR3YYQ0_9PEZI
MSDEPRPKRHKIGIACDMCRARKVKCDGGRPTCSNCLRRLALGDRCAYSDPNVSTVSATTPSRPTPRTAASVSATSDSVTPGFSEATDSPVLRAQQTQPTPLHQQHPNHHHSYSQSHSQPHSHYPHHPHAPHPHGGRPFPTPTPTHVHPHTTSSYGSHNGQYQHQHHEGRGTDVRSPSSGPATGPATGGSHASATSGPASGAIVADSMTVVGEEGTQTLQYFGSSSAGSFTRQIKEAIDAHMHMGAASASPSSAGPGTNATTTTLALPQRLAQNRNRHDNNNNNDDDDDNDDEDDEDGEADMLEMLPRRREADRLVGLYWRYVDPLYPFLERSTWTPAYEALFDRFDNDENDNGDGNTSPSHNVADDRVFISTLNIIFALSTQLSEGWPPPSCTTASSSEPQSQANKRHQKQQYHQQQQRILRQRERRCRFYFARAQKLLQSSLWETAGSLATVQFLLLASQYLQSTNSPHQTWMVVGSTIRTAQSLGLHLPGDDTGALPLAERELRRRLWHGCVLLDRMVSVTHGRPTMISSELCAAVPLPLCATQAAERGAHYDGPSLSFFIKSVKLYEIMNQVVSTFYSPAAATNMAGAKGEKDALAMLLKLDEDLLEWERGLPEYLRFDRLEKLDEVEIRQQNRVDCKPRQAVILHVRFLQARILLLRPVASRFCLDDAATNTASTTTSTSTSASSNDISLSSAPSAPSTFGVSSLRTRIKQDVAAICVDTARATIDVLERFGPGANPVSRDDIGLLPAWWYRVYYLYSAASILVLAKLRPDLFPAADTQRSWDQAMHLLDGHKRFGLAAHRCVAALEILGGQRQGQRQEGQGQGQGQSAQTGQRQPSNPLHLEQQQQQNQQQGQLPSHQQQLLNHQQQQQLALQQQYQQEDVPSHGLFINMRPDLLHQHGHGQNNHQRDHHAPFSDFDFAGLSFDAQDFSDLNLHAWEVLNQP